MVVSAALIRSSPVTVDLGSCTQNTAKKTRCLEESAYRRRLAGSDVGVSPT
jgi:hypothetical protein